MNDIDRQTDVDATLKAEPHAVTNGGGLPGRRECPECCAYSLTLVHTSPPKSRRPFDYRKVRVTALAGTVILNAEPDDWQQLANLPTSVTWYTGSTLPIGDAQDSWIIDNDFLLSLGPVDSGVRTIRVEWLDVHDVVRNSQRIVIPCLDDYDFETEWERYTVVEKGRENVFAYLEPDDCGDQVFESSKATTSCSLAPFAPTCSGGGQYAVLLQETEAAGSGTLYKYSWTVTTDNGSVVGTLNGNNASLVLPPGSYVVRLDLQDDGGDTVGECSAPLDLLAPEPAFTWSQVDCLRQIELDASLTANADRVSKWEWKCANVTIVIPDGVYTVADFSAAATGSYPITLRITDTYGCTWEVTDTTVKVVDCAASFEHKYSWCVDKIEPEKRNDITVTFTNTAVGCPPFSSAWKFGDGGTSTGTNPAHTYKDVTHGQSFAVSLTVTDSKGCSKQVTESILLQQRVKPDFVAKACPDGKVVCTTNEMDPTWFATGAPQIAPWPYTRRNKGRIIYKFDTDGVYFITMTSLDETSNECQRRKEITVKLECCAKNARVRGISNALTATVANKSVELRVKGKLSQVQAPLIHRVRARTVLQRKNSKGRWRRFRSPAVEIEASFNGSIYRSETAVFNWFDGSYYGGCNCKIQDTTTGSKKEANRRRVKAKDQIGARFRSRVHSIVSTHIIVVNGISSTMLSFSLGQQKDCASFNWWTDWF